MGNVVEDDATETVEYVSTDNTGGDEGKSADGAEPSDPKGPVGGEKHMDLGDEVAKATDPATDEVEKSAKASAHEGISGADGKSTAPEALSAEPKDTMMEKCVQKAATDSKHQSEQQ
ncbi:hypothetical protein ACS0TY_021799 [Phlomoides rotata]